MLVQDDAYVKKIYDKYDTAHPWITLHNCILLVEGQKGLSSTVIVIFNEILLPLRCNTIFQGQGSSMRQANKQVLRGRLQCPEARIGC